MNMKKKMEYSHLVESAFGTALVPFAKHSPKNFPPLRVLWILVAAIAFVAD
jgi:hypothetical protein